MTAAAASYLAEKEEEEEVTFKTTKTCPKENGVWQRQAPLMERLMLIPDAR